MASYEVKIKTADQYLAGTDANIFIVLYGALGISPEVRLNGLMSGNVFERNDLDCCRINLNDDCGDIYMIDVRSDCMYGGSDWLCDYISVQRVANAEGTPVSDSVVTFQFPAGEWIEDKNIHQYHATAGYPYDLPEHVENWMEVVAAKHHIPANLSMDITVKTTLDIDVSESSVKVISTSTGLEIGVEVDAIEATFKNQIDTSVNKQVDNKLHKQTEISSVVHVEPSENARTLQEIWSECDYTFSAKVGDDNTYQFRVPQNRVFSGFKEVDSIWPESFVPRIE